MPSSSSSNSKLRPGSRPRSGPESSSSRSESASGSSSESGSAWSSGSGSRSVSKSSHGSYSTSPKRNKKFSVTKLNNEQTGPSVLAKFQDRLAKNPWEAMVSKVRVPVHKIREKYHIPSDFDVIIPATFDRMHRPPEGFSAFSIKHLDAGLRFPLAPPVAEILNKLGLCPMQLSPNSITHIVLFVVIMQFVGLDPSFDNFWSLYSFTTSKRSGSRGFFYLSAKPECEYLSALKSNNKKKKGGEIASSSDPKGKGKAVADAPDLPSNLPPPVPSKALAVATPDGRQPIAVDSEDTPSAHGGHLGYNSSELELGLDEASGDHGADQGSQSPPPEERSKKRKRSSPKKGHGPKMAKEAADKTSVEEDRDKFLRVAQLATCWEDSRTALRGNVPPPEWQDMSSSSLYGEAGGDTFAVYNSFVSVRNQGALVTNNPIRLEEFAAHSMVQAMTFLRSLSLKCTHYRRTERDETERKQEDNLLALGDEVQKLRAELDASKKDKEILRSEHEVALSEAKKEAFEAGREAGLEEGRKRGVEEGQAGRIPIEEHQRILAGSRMSAVRDFLKTDTFTTALEIKSADSFAKGYETCLSQVEKLGRFSESFDHSKLDISLDGDLQPLPPDPELKDDEFMILRDELEAEADA
ncbi:UNVERIFIED_CONTAM: hypothetical protein Sindi_2340900 [Sesamum indicum]